MRERVLHLCRHRSPATLLRLLRPRPVRRQPFAALHRHSPAHLRVPVLHTPANPFAAGIAPPPLLPVVQGRRCDRHAGYVRQRRRILRNGPVNRNPANRGTDFNSSSRSSMLGSRSLAEKQRTVNARHAAQRAGTAARLRIKRLDLARQPIQGISRSIFPRRSSRRVPRFFESYSDLAHGTRSISAPALLGGFGQFLQARRVQTFPRLNRRIGIKALVHLPSAPRIPSGHDPLSRCRHRRWLRPDRRMNLR